MDDFYLIIAAIVIVLLLLCLTIAALLYVSGLTSPIDVGAGAPPLGQALVAYKFGQGPYKNVGNLFTEVYRDMAGMKALGIYYDDPNVVPSEKCRYAIGAVLSEGGLKVEPELTERLKSEGYNIIELPAVTNCVKSSFPYVNTMSIMIAVWRVYPKVAAYIKEHKLCAYPCLEIYEPDIVQFMAPLSQQEQFFVPEAYKCAPEEYGSKGDDSLFDISAKSSPAPSSRDSRSMSSFGRSYVSSRVGDDTYTDDESDVDNKLSDFDDTSNVQDDEVTSSVEVRASKACTNLLEESDANVCKEESIVTESKDDSVTVDNESGVSLQDSGICSGRTSAIPTETESLAEAGSPLHANGNDSSSSFEEITTEHVQAVYEGSDQSSGTKA